MVEKKEQETPKATLLKDYKKPDYLIDTVDLTFDLDEETTRVHSSMNIKSNHDNDGTVKPLFLDGEDLELASIKIDGRALKAEEYKVEDSGLTILNPPENFNLEIETDIHPKDNTELSGLYMSGGAFVTHNEPQGFRRITYFQDRPDVMAKYSTAIIAEKDKFPALLSNGNPVEEKDMEDGRHYSKWEDPFPKPSYLFAMVAGDLGHIKDKFKTASGRDVDLKIYCEHGKEDKCHYAMDSLKRSMKWDEEKFGREYDLDLFNVVAVPDFNAGAMENKGLNIFNDKAVLADKNSANDADHAYVERVVAHEYFHNWTGDRVTCANWFNLSLKEGLTVYRDQEFSSDMRSRPVRRIDDVTTLRAAQFPEDAGPLAHSVLPESYISIRNFYTSTVYKKGGEVIRMQEKLLGKDTFRKGMDLYFDTHDGKAVTIDDFVKSMEDVSGKDLKQFKRWYSQAGTP
ncbi:MAG: aminopeptidase N, partial [Alphaproteobacteria bacterium]|nr:aminopeptidase N [Alphaproteobacteria bacterium]